MASAQRPWAKGEEATHSPRRFETKGLCKLLAPLKHVSVMLSPVSVSREKERTTATQGKTAVGSVGSGEDSGQQDGLVSRTPTHTTLESFYYTVVQQYTT